MNNCANEAKQDWVCPNLTNVPICDVHSAGGDGADGSFEES